MSELPTATTFPNMRLQPVLQPEGTEDCFSAIATSVFGLPAERMDTVRAALQAAYVSEEDGSTGPPFDEMVVPFGDQQLTISPVISPFEPAESSADALARITASLTAKTPVAVMYIKPDKPTYHWVVLGDTETAADGSVSAVCVMNPEEPALLRVGVDEPWAADDLSRMIERSLASDGVFAYTLQVGPATPASAE
jgi:hypothetical protein